MDFRIVGSGLEAGGGASPCPALSGGRLIRLPKDPPHMICWEVGHIIDIQLVYGMFGCPPGAVGARGFGGLWRPVAACGALWRPVETDWMPLYKSLEPSMPGGLRLRCPDATLAGWLGWLGWPAAAGGLLLAGCCWLMGGSLTRSTLWGGRRICFLVFRIFLVCSCKGICYVFLRLVRYVSTLER